MSWVKFCPISCYIGSYTGDDESKCGWIKDWTEKWERNICVVTKTTGKHPQKSYSAVVRAIQLEWIFLKCATKDMGQVFAGVERIPR